MMRKRFNVLSLLATVALVAVVISGCDRREEVYPVEGNAYALDPAYQAALARQVEGRKVIMKDRVRTMKKLDELAKKFGDDKAALTNSVEYLRAREDLRACDEAIISNRMETARITRERIKRANEDSKRIERGEAKAIDISKKKEEAK